MMTASNEVISIFALRELVVQFFLIFTLAAARAGYNIVVVVVVTGIAVVRVIIVFVVIFTVVFPFVFDIDAVDFIEIFVVLIFRFFSQIGNSSGKIRAY